MTTSTGDSGTGHCQSDCRPDNHSERCGAECHRDSAGFCFDHEQGGHWRQRATYDSWATDVLGEDEHGDLWVPSRRREAWWDRRFCWWKPTHWPAYLRSRRRLLVAFIETDGSPRDDR